VLIGNRPSFECKFCGNLFKDKNILSHHKMMNLCHDYTCGRLLKMYPMMTKVEVKKFNKLREKFGKTFPN
jgi:ACR3 family arsenite efflux pump ArsB